jgi:hypothetical protein
MGKQMENTDLGRALALERCRLYLAQICAVAYCLESKDHASAHLRGQIFSLASMIRQDLSQMHVEKHSSVSALQE